MKVYVLTQGSYSDYHIVGIYSTAEKATEMYDVMCGNYDAPRIEEYELDELRPSMGYVCVGYTPETNKIRQYGFDFEPGHDSISSWTTPQQFICYLPYSARLSNPDVMLKAVQDHYMKWKAEQELF